MEAYCLKCKQNTRHKNCNIIRTKHNRLMITSNCGICDKKNLNLLSIKKLVNHRAI